MTESILTISIVGLVAGVVFSMPIAGPISVLITSNALKGNRRYCFMVSAGASVATFTYSFFAVYGLTKLFPYYKPAMPYLISVGSILLVFLGIKIFKSKLDISQIENKRQHAEKPGRRGNNGLYAGFLINILNPTLLLGWLTSTFWVISFISSVGINTGGLDISINKNIKEINALESNLYEDSLVMNASDFVAEEPVSELEVKPGTASHPKNFHLIISLFYAFFIAMGSTAWFIFLSFIIAKFRNVLNIKILSVCIKGLGIVLGIIGIYFGFLGTRMFINKLHL
jgi:threonine/homoserine/homoserine lactone efflux protein